MKILLQIGVVFGLYWVSQCIEAVLPFPFPASVISLLLLLALLCLRVIKIHHVQEKANFMLENLGFFFVPVSVGIMNYVDVVWENAIPFFVICVVSTVLTFAATVWTVQGVSRLMNRRKGEGK